jgi:integrase
LTARKVATVGDGWHGDGRNLFLRVNCDRRRWIVKVTRDGKKREFGVGGVDTTSLALARKRRDALLAQLAEGLNPKAEKQKAREAVEIAKAARRKRKTFGECAEAVIEARSNAWRTSSEGRTSSQNDWIKSFVRDCRPIRSKPVEDVTVEDVKKCVQPYWDKGNIVTARRLLNRIELAIEYALAHGWRTADNPATWKRFQHLAPATPKNGKRHHAALDWREVPAFMAKLSGIDTISARCVEFAILTAARSGEARGARWDEVNNETATWTIPPERMKANEEHVAPLSRQALDLLRRMETNSPGKLIFPSERAGRLMDISRVLKVVWSIAPDVTLHGFRSSFRSWCGDHRVERELAEQSLAHKYGSAVEQAYNRTQMLERRRPVMQRWADFVSGEADAGKVVKLKR